MVFNFLFFLDYFYYKEHLFIVCELLRENLYDVYKRTRDSGPLRSPLIHIERYIWIP